MAAPKRVNGRRVYDESVLQRLALVQLAQKAGWAGVAVGFLLSFFVALSVAE